MSAFLDAMQYDFMQHALVASMLAALLCAIVGTFIVIMRMVFLSGCRFAVHRRVGNPQLGACRCKQGVV